MLWAGQCLPPGPSALEKRQWVPHSGWPLDLAELEPYIRRAESLFAIEGEVYDERVWAGFHVEPPGLDPKRLTHRFSVWCPQPNLGRLYRDPLESSPNVRVLLNATVTELGLDEAREFVGSIRVATPEGKQMTVRARAFVLCTGGIENARLLLASDIGNRHDVVGRFFQDHPNAHCATISSENVGRLQELYGLLYPGGKRYLPRVVLSETVQQSAQVMACAAHPVFDFGEDPHRGSPACLPDRPRRPAARAPQAGAGPDGARPEAGPRGLPPGREGPLGTGRAGTGDAPNPRRAGPQPR